MWLTPAEILQDGPGGAATTLQMPRELLQKAEPGDELGFRDAREVMSRALSRLQQNGLIQIDGRQGVICDEQAMEVFAEG